MVAQCAIAEFPARVQGAGEFVPVFDDGGVVVPNEIDKTHGPASEVGMRPKS